MLFITSNKLKIIEEHVYSRCSLLTKIRIPEKIEEIGANVFSN